MRKTNAEIQKAWRQRNAAAIKAHMKMRRYLMRLNRENAHAAHDLAVALRAAIGAANCKHLAHWLANSRKARPSVSLAALKR